MSPSISDLYKHTMARGRHKFLWNHTSGDVLRTDHLTHPPDGPTLTPTVELENHFVLRLPQQPAQALREAIHTHTGANNLKGRLFIQLEPDTATSSQYLRRGHVQFDEWNFTCRLMDLPTMIESHKTIDKKTFYKVGDISQLLICKEGNGQFNDEEEESSLVKKLKDPNKVDKKYVYPHGVAPPLKNCKKRRFRKTLKQKYVEAPQTEKEVKRLLRVDNEAVSVTWELITQTELNANKTGESGHKDIAEVKPSPSDIPSVWTADRNDSTDLGLELTDSEEESQDVDVDSEAGSLVSVGENTQNTQDTQDTQNTRDTPTQGTPTLVKEHKWSPEMETDGDTQFNTDKLFGNMDTSTPAGPHQDSYQQLFLKRAQILHLESKKRELEHNISNCPNEALKNRFRQELYEVLKDIKSLEGN